MKIYNFTRLIKKYSRDFILSTRARGEYDGGLYVAGEETQTTMRGAIVPLGESKIYQSGGHYTAQDRDLYMHEPITAPLEDCTVIYNGNTYHVEKETEWSEFADVWEYVLKYVSPMSGDDNA